MQAGGLCATERREPCQAGNRAALSGRARAMQVVCSSAYPVTRYRRKAAVLAFRLFTDCLEMRENNCVFQENASIPWKKADEQKYNYLKGNSHSRSFRGRCAYV